MRLMASIFRRKRNGFTNELPFVGAMSILIAVAWFIYPHPNIAMWFGFAVAGYSAIANDSIQTLGTFLSSNKKVPWWLLWLFIGGILAACHIYGWVVDGGDIAFGRLSKIPQPQTFTFLTLCAPIILLILTKLRMPVSTTFLLLSTFSSAVVIQKMLTKTLLGYVVAFGVAILFWSAIALYVRRTGRKTKSYNEHVWRIFQVLSTGFLWSTWIMHDTANVAVFLPRTLNLEQMMLAVGYLVAVVGLLMWFKGGSIQQIVSEKTDITDIRSATIIDFVYAVVLVVFKQWNDIPMSTTWVFLGLLAGREIALTLLARHAEPYKTTAKLVFKDILRASLGLMISLAIVVYLI